MDGRTFSLNPRKQGKSHHHFLSLAINGRGKYFFKEEVGRQHQGMDRPGVHQVPKGSGEQGKMEDTGC